MSRLFHRNEGHTHKKLNEKSIQKTYKKVQIILNSLKFAKNQAIAKFDINEDNDIEDNMSNLYQLLKEQFGISKPFYYISWDKQKIHKYFIENFSNDHFINRSSSDSWWDDVVQFFMDELHYRTERKEVIEKDENGKNLLNKLKEIENKEFEIKINGKKLILPLKKEWEQLKKDWEEEKSQKPKIAIVDFLNKYKVFKNQKYHQHQKTRKMFSLPIITGQGHTLQKRTSWNKQDIFQIWSDADSRKDNNKFSSLTFNQSELKEVVNKSFISKKQFKLNLKPRDFFLKTDNLKKIDPNQWYNMNIPDELKKYIKKLEYQLDNVTRPKIRLTPQENINVIKKNYLTKAKNDKEAKKLDELTKASSPIEYTGSGFNEDVKKELLKALNKVDQ